MITNYYFFFLPILCTIGMISCKTQDTTSTQMDENVELVLLLQKSGCSGECPAFKFELYDDKRVKYTGLRYVEKIGAFEGNINPEIYKNMISLLDSYRLDEYNSVYKKRSFLDLSTTTLIYNEKKISYEYSQAPDSLRELTAKIIELIDQIVLLPISEH